MELNRGDALGRSAHFEYFRRENILCEGHRTVFKGMPALLLSHMLRAFHGAGRSTFTLSELRKVCGSNLEARLERIARRLSRSCSRILLIRRPGFRILHCDDGITWNET